MSDSRVCLFCRTPSEFKMHFDPMGFYAVKCPQCKVYFIQEEMLIHPVTSNVDLGLRVACVLRRRVFDGLKPPIIFCERPKASPFGAADEARICTTEDLAREFPSTVADRLVSALENLAMLSRGRLGHEIDLNPDSDRAVVFALDDTEYDYVFAALSASGLVNIFGAVNRITKASVSPEGWNRLSALQRGIASNEAFVAMSFQPDMRDSYEQGFRKAIESCGLRPVRADRSEANTRIDDDIILAIQRCRLIIVDCTWDRSAVYFEAGLAMGLRKPLIWCCRQDRAGTDMCFDSRQYRHILWTREADLTEQLERRIRATLAGL